MKGFIVMRGDIHLPACVSGMRLDEQGVYFPSARLFIWAIGGIGKNDMCGRVCAWCGELPITAARLKEVDLPTEGFISRAISAIHAQAELDRHCETVREITAM